MDTNITREERIALEILRLTKLNVVDVALLTKELVSETKGNLKKARQCIRLGAESLKRQEKSVTFAHAASVALEKRKDRRPRTIIDFRYFCKRLMRFTPELAQRRMRSITAAECAAYLHRAFDTPQQFKKARAILSGVFSTAYKQGWCDENPVLRVETPRIQEKPIQPLSTEEITRLENTVETPEYQDMALSLHLMLYCGIRPKEVSRINPEQDIDEEAKEVIVRPSTSKTGGGRVVPLRKIGKLSPTQWQIPRNWEKRWRALRRAARFEHWQQDACRHTFATYHARYFKNLHALQLEMGHSNLRLLLSRYILADKVNAAAFWQ